ncbi:MAG: hypothetical protein H6742_10145 [Alphaproteobacteria bacterium]|nr:hypothetical protein [Alphaproteobacteria bacterium]
MTSISLLAVLLAGCGSSSPSTDTGSGGTDSGASSACPDDGTVPANFRDTERDAEGVSYSTFGAFPDREPDFTRATGVLGLLQEVWTAGLSDCPDVGSDVQLAIDDAIATLEVSIPAEDQETSAYAANDIHMQMAPLFESFAPETPVEIVEMDALFLRIGLDAWFGYGAEYDADLARIQEDWAVVKGAAEAKVPTCHRVAGTESVVGDLDETIANLAAAPSASDQEVAQVESEAGLLEVDILELLFDCVPDGQEPDSGLGSSCAVDADCGDASLVCDLDNRGGTCAPDPDLTHVGEACTTTVDCGTYSRDACNSEIGDDYPGGYCVMEPCDDVTVCSPGATCVAMPYETPACMASCSDDSDCRVDEGYVCQLFPTTPPVGFGPSDHACAFACTQDADCTSPLTCDVGSGKCVP